MPFDFNIYSSLLLPSFIQGILFASLLFFRSQQENKVSDFLLASILLLNSLKVAFWMLGFAGWYDTHDGYTSFMFYFPFNNLILISPLIYFYFISLTNTAFKFQKIHLPHFILPMLWLMLIIAKFAVDYLFYYPFPETVDSQFGTKGVYAELDKSLVMVLLGYVSFFFYVFLTLREFTFYKAYLNENFSSTEKISFKWIQNLLLGIIGCGVVMFVFMILSLLMNGFSYLQDWNAYFILGGLIYYISIHGYFTKPSGYPDLNYIPQNKPGIQKQKEVKATAPEILLLKEKLALHLAKESPFLNPELTLSELASQMNTNSALLSKTINEGFNQNFNDYINSHRVKEVICKLDKGAYKNHTIEGIAYTCGFNSKATFNRAFKKIIQKTPLEYIRSIK